MTTGLQLLLNINKLHHLSDYIGFSYLLLSNNTEVIPSQIAYGRDFLYSPWGAQAWISSSHAYSEFQQPPGCTLLA